MLRVEKDEKELKAQIDILFKKGQYSALKPLLGEQATLSPEIQAHILLRAVEHNAYPCLPDLVACGVNLNTPLNSHRQTSALAYAARRGSFAMVEALLALEVDVNAGNPLKRAIEALNIRCVRAILGKKPKLKGIMTAMTCIERPRNHSEMENYIKTFHFRFEVIKYLLEMHDHYRHNVDFCIKQTASQLLKYGVVITGENECLLERTDAMNCEILHLLFPYANNLAAHFELFAIRNILIFADLLKKLEPKIRVDILNNLINLENVSLTFLQNIATVIKSTDDAFGLDPRYLIFRDAPVRKLRDLQSKSFQSSIYDLLLRDDVTPSIFVEIIKLLAGSGYPLRFVDSSGRNLLHYCYIALANSLSLIQNTPGQPILGFFNISKKAKMAEQVETYSRLACSLAKRGVNPFIKDEENRDPSLYLAEWKDPLISRKLTEVENCYRRYLYCQRVFLLSILYFHDNKSEVGVALKKLPLEIFFHILSHLDTGFTSSPNKLHQRTVFITNLAKSQQLECLTDQTKLSI